MMSRYLYLTIRAAATIGVGALLASSAWRACAGLLPIIDALRRALS